MRLLSDAERHPVFYSRPVAVLPFHVQAVEQLWHARPGASPRGPSEVLSACSLRRRRSWRRTSSPPPPPRAAAAAAVARPPWPPRRASAAPPRPACARNCLKRDISIRSKPIAVRRALATGCAVAVAVLYTATALRARVRVRHVGASPPVGALRAEHSEAQQRDSAFLHHKVRHHHPRAHSDILVALRLLARAVANAP
eukprot:3961461-Pleurochrysis_carterae.AAC.2